MEMNEEIVRANIIKIRDSKGDSKRKIAAALGINEASYGRIESGKISLSFDMLAKIASYFNMSVIDVIGYPNKYVVETEATKDPVRAILQIELQQEKKDQVLKLIFGEHNIEVLSK